MAERSEIIYLHLRPGRYGADLLVTKMAKTEDAEVAPGDVVVKLKVKVPDGFFSKARPYHEVEFQPGNELVYEAEEVDPDAEG